MADGEQSKPRERFKVTTASLESLDCGPFTAAPLLSVLGELDDTSSGEPLTVARAIFRAVAKKADGSKISATEAAQVTEPEIEAFAVELLRHDDTLRPATWSEGEPAIPALAAEFKTMHDQWASERFTGIGAVRGLSGLKDSIAVSAARALSTPTLARGNLVGKANSEVERMVAAVPPKPRPADIALRKLEERRAAFAENLSEDREVAMVVASGPGGPCFYMTEMEAITANLISFRGLDDDGEPVEVVQDASQCNVMFLPIRKVAAKGPLGFRPDVS